MLDAEDAIKIDVEGATDADEAGWLRWIESKGKRVQEGYERALADPIKLNGPLNVWLPRLMLVLVPIFALLLAIMHWWPRVFLFEHLVFSIHIHTVVFVACRFHACRPPSGIRIRGRGLVRSIFGWRCTGSMAVAGG